MASQLTFPPDAEAGRALERAAELELDVNRDTDAIRTFKEAADTYDTTDPTGKIRCLQRVINYWVDTKGQFTTAAVYQKNLGELYLNQLNDKDKAIEAYQLAADWYGGAQPQ
jgi:alpha-soluble NSF attachment protein